MVDKLTINAEKSSAEDGFIVFRVFKKKFVYDEFFTKMSNLSTMKSVRICLCLSRGYLSFFRKSTPFGGLSLARGG